MIRTLFCLSAPAVVALSVLAWFAFAQEESDPFGPLSSSADENPFAELGPTAPTDAEQQALINDLVQHPTDRAASGQLCRCAGESESVAKIQQTLRRQLTPDGLTFEDAPLADVAAFIHETYEIPIQLDTPALEEIGVGPDEPVTVNFHGISLQSALRLLLDSIQSTYIVRNDVLLITVPEVAESELTTCVYDVRDLLEAVSKPSFPRRRESSRTNFNRTRLDPRLRGDDIGSVLKPVLRRTRPDVDFDSLIDTIISCIATDTWAENGGGESEVRPLSPGFLVISQTSPVHEEICGLLTSIRELKSRPVAAAADAGLNGSLDEAVTEWNVRHQ